jgi:hypothetical protein
MGDANGGVPRGELIFVFVFCADTVPNSYAQADTVPYSYAQADTLPISISRFQRHANVECGSPDQQSRDKHHRIPIAFGIGQRKLHTDHQSRKHNHGHGVASDKWNHVLLRCHRL